MYAKGIDINFFIFVSVDAQIERKQVSHNICTLEIVSKKKISYVGFMGRCYIFFYIIKWKM